MRPLLSYIPTTWLLLEFIVKRNEERGGAAEGTTSAGFKGEACDGRREEAGTERGVLQLPGVGNHYSRDCTKARVDRCRLCRGEGHMGRDYLKRSESTKRASLTSCTN